MTNGKEDKLKIVILDKNLKLFGKLDLFFFLIILLSVSLFVLGLITVFQEDEYVTVEVLSSAGEWWWNTEPPPYWLSSQVMPGDIEYDFLRKKLVQVLDVQKIEEKDRAQLWIKAKLLVDRNKRTGKLRFKQLPLEVGDVIMMSPNKNSITGNVIWIEGMNSPRLEEEHTALLKVYNVYPWYADLLVVGDKMLDNKGDVLAEIEGKSVEIAEKTVVTDQGSVLPRRDPYKRDVTIKVRIKTTQTDGKSFFAFTQAFKAGNKIDIAFQKTDFDGQILSVD